jgi:hexosaminidase
MTPSLVPLPERMEVVSGTFRLPSPDRWAGNAEALGALGRWLPMTARSSDPRGRILFREDFSRSDLGEEGYELSVRPREARAVARTPAGLVFAAQTLRQLAAANNAVVPCCHILDRPRFSWRGIHLDCARHFFPVDTVLRMIELASLHKLNRFHWHLTDDQGWRLQVRARPRLTAVGAGAGRFYTHRDVRRVVARARELGIKVIPEIDLPGHMQAAIAAYPELGSGGGRVAVRKSWGISRHVLNAEPGTIQFLEEVLAEVLLLFPGRWIHLGGDEVLPGQWKKSRAVQRRMRQLGLTTERQLQGWFARHFAQWLAERGRVMVGWDEILESTDGRLPAETLLMSWRSPRYGIKAARAGHDVVMTPTSRTYFDYSQGPSGPRLKLVAGQKAASTLRKVYEYDPVPDSVAGVEADRILGTQGQLWSERIPDQDTLDRQAFPRMCALSEVCWSPRESRSWRSFQERLPGHLGLLADLGVRYYRGEGA